MDVHSASQRFLGLTARRWRTGAVPGPLAQMLLVAVGYYAAARVGFAFTLQPNPISTLWPPNALLLAVLLLAPARAWWWLLAAALPAHLLIELQSGVPTAMVLGWYASNCSEALIGAALVRAFAPGPLRLDSLRKAGLFLLCAVLAAPLLSSFFDAALVRLIGWGESEYWDLVQRRFASNVLAELTVGPLILTWATFSSARLRAATPARYAEAALIFGGLFAVCLVAFDLPQIDARAAPALFYAPLPFLLWAAVRLGTPGAASAIALLTVATIGGAVSGLGPFTDRTAEDTAREMQLFLIAASVPMLLLAVALEERSRAEREAHEQRLQLTHLARVAMLGELSGGIAHELNQPLTAILSNAQAAQHFIANKTGSPQVLSEILQDIVLADLRAGEIIRRLHTLFKRGETQFRPLDMNTVVGEVLDIARGDLATRSVDVRRHLGESIPAVSGDRVELQQVLLNLVVNASEAMSAGTAPGRRVLTVCTGTEAGMVKVSVIDSGPGFPAEQHERMFEAFYTTKAQGLGLGLSISRAIVRVHNGHLWGEANPGGGASFHVTLPAA
ncbi:MAG TPA: MASE1 domain-containing protein [Burkholderiales bacterium]|nr:MASE1 domain-containing protein [Burkholderiales bacterium]